MYNFDAILKYTNLALLLSGININNTKCHPIVEFYVNNCLFYFNFLWLYTDVIAEFFWLVEGIQTGKSILELSMIAPCTAVCLLATAKSTPVYFKRRILNDIVDKLRDLHKEVEGYDEILDDETEKLDEKRVVKESIILLKFVMLLLRISAASVVALFCFMPITLMAYDYYKNDKYDVMFPFLVKYFFDPFPGFRWPVVYFHQVISTFIVWVNVYGPDTFLYAFCVYMQMHFRILSQRLRTLFHKPSRVVEDKEKLCILLKRHQQLIQLVKSFESLYSSSNLFNVVISSILICLCAFNATVTYIYWFLDNPSIKQQNDFCFFGLKSVIVVLQVLMLTIFSSLMALNVRFVKSGTDKITRHWATGTDYSPGEGQVTNPDAGAVLTFICFLFMNLSQISILCFFGDMIVDSSAQVAEAAYSCGWYNVDGDVRKTLLIVIMRAHNPCKLTAANFAVLNLRAFATIISKSWSYFALLKTAYK